MTKNCFFGLGLIVSLLAASLAEDAAWPGFRGPNASGVGVGARPPVEFGPSNQVVWVVEAPGSPSSPVVAGARLFLTSFTDGKLETRAYATQDGQLLWQRVALADQLEDFHATAGSPAASTPATDGQYVVSYFGSSGLSCYDVEGRERWQLRLPVAETHGGFGSGTSPLIAGKRVVLNRDVISGASILAVDLETGQKLWETPRPEAATSYSTPVLWRVAGREDVVVAGAIMMKAYDLESGAERWLVQGLPAAACTTPVVGDGFLLFAGWGPGQADAPFPSWEAMLKDQDKNGDGWLGVEEVEGGAATLKSMDFDKNGRLEQSDWDRLTAMLARGENSVMAIQPGGQGDITRSHVAWKATRGLPYVPSPICYEGRVYFVKDGGLVSCHDAKTGEAYYVQERLPKAEGTYYSSPVAADGHLYFTSLKGVLTVVRAGGSAPEVVHQADFKERMDATPALVGNRLYLRTKTKLYAFARP